MVDTNDPATILPAATTQEGDALIGALRLLNDGGYSRAETHLREAGVQINAGEWAESVRESIHAVESVARQLDPRGGKSFDDAIKALEDRGRIHPALRKAFGGLYGLRPMSRASVTPYWTSRSRPWGGMRLFSCWGRAPHSWLFC